MQRGLRSRLGVSKLLGKTWRRIERQVLVNDSGHLLLIQRCQGLDIRVVRLRRYVIDGVEALLLQFGLRTTKLDLDQAFL